METRSNNIFEQALEQMARGFEYSPTPDMAAAVKSRTTGDRRRIERGPWSVVRRLSWALLLIALAAAALFAIPQTRAAVLSLFARIGAINIFIDDTMPPPPPEAPTTLPVAPSGGAVEHSLALFELGEPVGLDEARRLTDFAIAVPAALGQPDEVYVHRDAAPPAVTLVWRDEDGTPISLTEIGAEAFATKLVAEEGVTWLKIGGQGAIWLEGPHQLQLLGHLKTNSLLIESNVLIWSADKITYRLEGDLSQLDMVAVAESIDSSSIP
jgi:hypothetical protein